VYYVLTAGGHPFGDPLERESNITKRRADLTGVSHMPEAADLIRSMIAYDAADRLSAEDACQHPLFWSAEKKLHFLQDVSDRVEAEPPNGPLRRTLESRAAAVIGPDGWERKLDPSLIDNLGKYRKYDFMSVRDLLRVIRYGAMHCAPHTAQCTVPVLCVWCGILIVCMAPLLCSAVLPGLYCVQQ
jgi:serine/threonine-protein kinase/endoribonuclease IRE1